MEWIQQIETLLQDKFPSKPCDIKTIRAYKVSNEHLSDILQELKSAQSLRFTILTDLFIADFPERENRFEIVYNLLSLHLNARLVIKTEVAENMPIASVAGIFSAATWYEREAFDMYGVEFSGCPDPRRILTDYGFVGHPLRKDFPLSGHVQIRYSEELETIVHEPVALDQEYRDFDFTSSWQGPKFILPGDEKATKQS